MKMLKFLPVIIFGVALVFATSCGGSDASKGADLMCEMKGLQNDLMKAQEDGDEDKIKDLSGQLEEKMKEMTEFGKEMEEKYKDDKEGEKKAKKEMFEALTECEHYSKEELEEIKKYQGIDEEEETEE